MSVNQNRNGKETRVIKTLAPTDRGAIELAKMYGKSLVCVRHRTGVNGKIRHTTVELVVESKPIAIRPVKLVLIKTEPHEVALHEVIRVAGGKWDYRQSVWRLPSRLATVLKLRTRIVKP